MNEWNTAFVSLAICASVAAISVATWAIKTAGVDTHRAGSAQIEACAKHGGTYVSDGQGSIHCIQAGGVVK